MSDLIGAVIGPYHITEQLGVGGMAEVYKAYHTGLDVYRALKFIRPEIALAGNFRDRFQREARSVARLRHPNIVQVFDFGEHEGRFYMVMEYIDGHSLKQLIAGGKRMPVDRALALVKAVAGALDYAHQQGLIHRDIKPDNIMVDARQRVVLMDFGIARLIEGDGKQLTGTGMNIGTPEYMAPEQLLAREIGPFTDVYALAVVLFELLTGRTPFQADTPFAVGLKILHDPIPIPRSLSPEISESIQGVLLKGTAKAADARHQTAAEFMRAVEQEERAPVGAVRAEAAADAARAAKAAGPIQTVVLPEQKEKKSGGRLIAGMASIAAVLVVVGVVFSGGFDEPKPSPETVPVESGPALTKASDPEIAPSPESTDEDVNPSAGESSSAVSQSYRLTVRPEPDDALVRVLNITPKYQPGMLLEPGDYNLEISRDGFVTATITATIASADLDVPVRLAELPAVALTEVKVLKPTIEIKPEVQISAQGTFSGPLPKMVSIPGRPIRMGAYEVTFEEYDAYAAATGKPKPEDEGWGRGRRPVINVSWDDATAYVAWLSQVTGDRYRLPTEAEWEHATRAGTTSEYWWGDEIGVNRANCGSCESQWDNKMTAPVGSFSANPFGLYDVHGNVYEWTQDCYDGDCGRRVLRGGSWNSLAEFLRASNRLWYDPADRDFAGFRLAQDL